MKPHRKMSPTLKRFLIFYFVFALVFICAYIPVYSYMHGTIYENVRAQAQQREHIAHPDQHGVARDRERRRGRVVRGGAVQPEVLRRDGGQGPL